MWKAATANWNAAMMRGKIDRVKGQWGFVCCAGKELARKRARRENQGLGSKK